MVSVLFTILKIIGITTLIVLGIILFLLLLILFVPVRYKAKGSYQTDYTIAQARATWLLHVFSVNATYCKGDTFHVYLKLFGIPVYDNLKTNSKKNKNKKVKPTKTNPDEHMGEIQAASVGNVSENTSQEQAKDATAQKLPADNSLFDKREEKHSQKDSIFQKIKKILINCTNFFKNITFTFRRICDTMVKIKDNIKYYLNLLQLDSTKKAFSTCSKQLKWLLKNLAPKKYHVHLHLGFGDPATMGEVLAVWGMLYPWHLGNIDIQPEFEQTVAEGTFSLKGHISVFIFVRTACILFFDKDIKLLIKHLKRNL